MIYPNTAYSPRYLREQYNYESNLFCGYKLNQLLPIVQTGLEVCPTCRIRKKNHYCLESTCPRKELICPECDVASIEQPHYMHDYTYILPLMSRDIFCNFNKLKQKLKDFRHQIMEEIHKIEEYLVELRKVADISLSQVEKLDQEELEGKMAEYPVRMEEFLKEKQPDRKIKDVLSEVRFISTRECSAKEEQFKNELLGALGGLKWPKDPQRVLKDKLRQSQEDEKKEMFVSAHKQLEMSEIDNTFRVNQEYYTHGMEHHMVEVAIEPDLFAKPKFYESFIYHFRNCKQLKIDNGSLSHLRTPLAFRALEKLEFTFHVEAQPQHLRVQNVNDQLRDLTLKRFREEDLKVLKQIIVSSPKLKHLHMEFSNKIDLYTNRDLIDTLKNGVGNQLTSFTLKIRTENEVKRLYGYLSKFYKDSSDSQITLNTSLLDLIDRNHSLTKVVVEGVKPLEMGQMYQKLRQLPFLMDYKVYYENVDLMTQVSDKEAKQLQKICYQRKRIFYGLAKASKDKIYPNAIVEHIFSGFLV